MKYGKRSRYGDPPHWYTTIQAGDRLHCPPWDVDPLEGVARFTWRARAIMAVECEHDAGEYHRKQAERRNRQRGPLRRR